MLDFGWAELLIIAAVAVFVIGPKDIPNVMHGLGRIIRRMQYIRFAITQQFDDLMQAADVEELRRGVNFEQKRNMHDVNHEADEDALIEEDSVSKETASVSHKPEQKETEKKETEKKEGAHD